MNPWTLQKGACRGYKSTAVYIWEKLIDQVELAEWVCSLFNCQNELHYVCCYGYSVKTAIDESTKRQYRSS